MTNRVLMIIGAILLITVGLLFFIFHDSADISTLKNHVKLLHENAAKEASQRTAFTLKIPKPISYSAGLLNAPFGQTTVITKNLQDQTNPLRGYPLAMLRFVGTMAIDAVQYAFVMAPDNMVYQVAEGDLIGPSGKVISVQPRQLDVMEVNSDNGNADQHVISLQLKEER